MTNRNTQRINLDTALAFAPTDEQIFAFVYTYLGDSEEVRIIREKFRSLDKHKIGIALGVQQGHFRDISVNDLEEAEDELVKYESLKVYVKMYSK